MTTTATVTEKAASLVPTTHVSTMVFTEKMLPVTVYMTSTATQPGQMTTMTESLSATLIQTERVTATTTTTSTTTAIATTTVNVSCVPTTILNSVKVPTTLISTVTEARLMTLTQKNVITVTGGVMTSTSVSTAVQTATITKVSTAPTMACPLQEKIVTRIIISTRIPSSSSMIITSKYSSATMIPTYYATTTKVQVPIITSSKSSDGSICPTPTVSSVQKTSATTGSSVGCQEGKKRCDIYDRRSFNECKGGQWTNGVKLTEADNLQCEESSGTVKLVPIPAKNFNV